MFLVSLKSRILRRGAKITCLQLFEVSKKGFRTSKGIFFVFFMLEKAKDKILNILKGKFNNNSEKCVLGVVVNKKVVFAKMAFLEHLQDTICCRKAKTHFR